MKIAVAKEHRDFFKKNGWIEFDNIFSLTRLDQLNAAVDFTLADRLKISTTKLLNALPESLYLEGRDLWRDNDQLRQLVSSPRLGEIVSELIELKPLRLGFDQILQAANGSRIPKSSNYAKFLQVEVSLQSLSSVKGLVAGMLICLDNPSEAIGVDETNIYPRQAGNVTVFNPESLINFSHLINHSNQRFYLIAYAQSSSYYIHEPNDPHLHALKKYGYAFNEKLTDKLNPIIYR